MSFMNNDDREPPEQWTPAEGYVAVAFIVILALAGAACAWIQAINGGA